MCLLPLTIPTLQPLILVKRVELHIAQRTMISHMHINCISTPSLTWTSTSLTTQQVEITGTTWTQSSFAAQGVNLGAIGNTAANIKLNGTHASYIYYTKRHFTLHGCIDCTNTTSHFYFYANKSVTNK